MTDQLKALVVHESMFGNTARVARAVSAGLREEGVAVEVLPVAELPAAAVGAVDLLVLGAPTHAFSLSRASTRMDAVRQGAPAGREVVGMREWLEGLSPGTGTAAAVFDTRVEKVRRLPMNAARKLGRLVRARGYRLVVPPEGFLVVDTTGPLADGQLESAREWGAAIGTALARRSAGTRA